MTAPFSGALGVVRAQIAPDVFVSAVPRPVGEAALKAAALINELEGLGGSERFVAFDMGDGVTDCWIRARSVLTVDVVPTEDPSS